MSNKSSLLRARGDGKSVTVTHQILKGQRNGKGVAAVAFEVWDEMSVYPPATAKEAEAFCRIQMKRCHVNLANAKDRGDKQAIIHLERKLAIYEYLHRLVQRVPAPTECSHCRVTAVENGICACCGQKTEVEL